MEEKLEEIQEKMRELEKQNMQYKEKVTFKNNNKNSLTGDVNTVDPVTTRRPWGQIDLSVFRGVQFIQVRSFAENAIKVHMAISLI